jgi:polysaccharide biosynthesis transport protein
VMTPQYTATARIVIDPPAGADLRAAMAVSPIYLESLKTYERFADSDSLFQKAVLQFGLHGGPIESLKRRVLQVQLVRNTRILEISATLPDAKKAQALARFLAESTVEINRASVSESDQDLMRGIEQQARDLRAKLQEADASWAKAVAAEPLLGLQAAMEQAAELRSKIEEQAQSVELELADLTERAKNAAGAGDWQQQESNARARLLQLRKQLEDLDRQSAERERLLATRQAHRDQLDAERKAGQTALAAMEARLRDARGETGFRGERLKLIDPGIVPERPSSPNLPLNIAAALLAGLILPILFLTLQMSFQDRRAALTRTTFRTVAKARDE